jgi:hypothetical protein
MTQKLREHTGDPEACYPDSFVTITEKIGDKNKNSIKVVPVMTAYYRDKKQDGTLAKRVIPHEISIGYCPFCGVALFDGVVTKKEAS